MAGTTLDAWTKLVAGRTSRRRLLAALAGLGLGAVGAGRIGAADPTPTATSADAVPPGPYPTPLSQPFGTCPATGKGGDPDLNSLKNRSDAVPADQWQPVTVAAILSLPEPAGTTKYLHNWPKAAAAQVAPYLGAPVRVEAFPIGVKRSGGEATNCNGGASGKDDQVDYHLTFAAAGDTFDRAVVAEVTPRIRAQHPSWTLEALGALLAEETPVRLSGWLLLDPKHADHVGQIRGTRWEVHPVLRIEVLREGEWEDLDGIAPTLVPIEGPDPTPVPTEEADMDCADFKTHAEAQAF